MKSLPTFLAIACAAFVFAVLAQARAAVGGQGAAQATTAQAASAPQPQAATSTSTSTSTDPRAFIASKVPGAKPEDVRATPIPGLYEIMRGTDAAYVTADGKYAIAGDLYDLRSDVNLTDNERRATRLKLLDQIPESQMVIFGEKSEPHTITVFTDVDCPYCRKLHSQIADYNRLGIRVRYMFYPRTGPNTPSWTRAEEVWCSSDRHTALTKAKLGESLHVQLCPNTPVAREYELGRELNIEGTPAIVLGNGDMLPGYVSPTE
ncbi:MAG TPA: DsbC family protein, partial [Steroidobacteraceae bacterium]|nr:DsbC family protein [Steroidobacteraceae bacterium]